MLFYITRIIYDPEHWMRGFIVTKYKCCAANVDFNSCFTLSAVISFRINSVYLFIKEEASICVSLGETAHFLFHISTQVIYFKAFLQ